jgi:hypothetical protein
MYIEVSQKIVLGGFVIESTSGCFANWTIRALHSTKYTKLHGSSLPVPPFLCEQIFSSLHVEILDSDISIKRTALDQVHKMCGLVCSLY